MGGGIGAESQLVFFGGVAEGIEHDPGLHAGDAALGIDLENLRHVLGKIEHDGNVAALAGEGGAASAAELVAHRIGGRGPMVARTSSASRGEHNADRNLAVVGAVSGVEGARAAIKADFAANSLSSRFRQPKASTCADLAACASSANESDMPRSLSFFRRSVRRRICRVRFTEHIGNLNLRLAAFSLNIDGNHGAFAIVRDDRRTAGIGTRDHGVGKFRFVKLAILSTESVLSKLTDAV